ncbi:MAG: hypothetical protein K0R94_555 [Burkholderiales bacterium]|nr:hypothetical protein [Burkholderiales bacterium]
MARYRIFCIIAKVINILKSKELNCDMEQLTTNKQLPIVFFMKNGVYCFA